MKYVQGFTIYYNPNDYPGKYVVREWRITHEPVPEGFFKGIPGVQHAKGCRVLDTLEDARAVIPPGKYNIGREKKDDPVIVETWV